jgi:hypothetical protein
VTLLEHQTLALLGSIRLGRFRLDGETLACEVRPGRDEAFPAECLDLAEARGWLAIDAGGPRLTEAGNYWLDRWARVAAKEHDRRQLDRLRPQRG